MDANENENETADGVREYDDDSINKGIDTEESVVPENGTELLVFEKKDIRSKGAYNDSTLLASSFQNILLRSCWYLFRLCRTTTHFLYHIFHMKTLSVFRSLSSLRCLFER